MCVISRCLSLTGCNAKDRAIFPALWLTLSKFKISLLQLKDAENSPWEIVSILSLNPAAVGKLGEICQLRYNIGTQQLRFTTGT